MALDVYVGSLRRYYSGQWQGVDEKPAPGAAGTGRRRPAAAVDEFERVYSAVLDWRRNLADALADTAPVDFDWDESAEGPYFTGQPGWDGLGSLVLWAAYADTPALRRPATLPEEWDDDPALIRCNAEGFRSRFSHLVRNVELWLPAPLPFTFEGEDVGGRRIVMGSTETLLRQLGDLNNATWKAKPDDIARWARRFQAGPQGRRQPANEGGLESLARHAYSVMSDLARKAVAHRLPMKLDF